MPKQTPPRPTDAEMEIRGPSTVREVYQVICQQKPTVYTTVLKLL
jgi:hypothetical protein